MASRNVNDINWQKTETDGHLISIEERDIADRRQLHEPANMVK